MLCPLFTYKPTPRTHSPPHDSSPHESSPQTTYPYRPNYITITLPYSLIVYVCVCVRAVAIQDCSCSFKILQFNLRLRFTRHHCVLYSTGSTFFIDTHYTALINLQLTTCYVMCNYYYTCFTSFLTSRDVFIICGMRFGIATRCRCIYRCVSVCFYA